jgi:alkylhydroperoxidase family enzyme
MAWIDETHEHAAEGVLKEAYARIRTGGHVIPFYRAYSVSPPPRGLPAGASRGRGGGGRAGHRPRARPSAEGRVAGAEAVILGYALKLTRTPRTMRAEDVRARRDASLAEPEVFEVASLTAYFNYTNRVGEGLGVEPE